MRFSLSSLGLRDIPIGAAAAVLKSVLAPDPAGLEEV